MQGLEGFGGAEWDLNIQGLEEMEKGQSVGSVLKSALQGVPAPSLSSGRRPRRGALHKVLC